METYSTKSKSDSFSVLLFDVILFYDTIRIELENQECQII